MRALAAKAMKDTKADRPDRIDSSRPPLHLNRPPRPDRLGSSRPPSRPDAAPRPDRPRPGPHLPPPGIQASTRRARPPHPQPPSNPSTDGEYSPLPWDGCFDEVTHVTARDARFTFYLKGVTPTRGGPVLLLLHGAGCGALSFACLARELGPHVAVAALDLRGHGSTVETGDPQPLSSATFVADVIGAIRALFASRAETPPLVLAGHSMGGAVAARVATSGDLPVVATALIDVVEGTALSALPHMRAWLAGRPSSFASVEAAVRWVVARGYVRNADSARRSVPVQLVERDGRWEWRTDLEKTCEYWRGWFEGLSGIFLEAKGPKLLVVAGVDRLDRALIIAQMQGKFQYMLIPEAGHSIAEDQPEKTAKCIVEFLRRNLLIEETETEDL